MLTSTYTLVALSIERTAARGALQSLADELQTLPGDYVSLACGRAAQLCANLRNVVDNCHWRKLDKFLIPVLRGSSRAAEELLQDLERLSFDAGTALAAAEACIGAGDRPVDRERFCDAVEACTGALRRRLEREEDELLPLARGTVAGDAWFAMPMSRSGAARRRASSRMHACGMAWSRAPAASSATRCTPMPDGVTPALPSLINAQQRVPGSHARRRLAARFAAGWSVLRTRQPGGASHQGSLL